MYLNNISLICFSSYIWKTMACKKVESICGHHASSWIGSNPQTYTIILKCILFYGWSTLNNTITQSLKLMTFVSCIKIQISIQWGKWQFFEVILFNTTTYLYREKKGKAIILLLFLSQVTTNSTPQPLFTSSYGFW